MKTTTVKKQKYDWTTELDNYITELKNPESVKKHTWPAISLQIQTIFGLTIPHTTIRHHYITKLTHKVSYQSSENTEPNTTKSATQECPPKSSRSRNWTHELDSLITNEVNQQSTESKVKWKDISKKVQKEFSVVISAKTLREHYINKLDPTLIHTKITPEESLQIQKWVDDEGHHWAKFGRLLNRPDNDIKNHYNTFIKKLKKESLKQNLGPIENSTSDYQFELKLIDYSNLNMSILEAILEEGTEQSPFNSFNVDDYLSDYPLYNIGYSQN